MDLSRADLGLLLSLDALLEEGSVSRAALRLGLSQPALSAQLARLRALFGDKLLVPSGRRMVPTARAEALRAPLHTLLDQMRDLVREQRRFDPTTAAGSFRIAATDYLHRAVPLVAWLRHRAPAVQLVLLSFDAAAAWSQLENDAVDLLIASERLTPAAAQARRLFEERLVLVQRRGHPRGTAPLTLDTFCALEQVLVSPEGGGLRGAADAALATLGRERRVVASLPSFLLVPPLIRESDLVALLPERMAARLGDLEAYPLPFALPGFAVFASWHARRQRDPAHQWLREQVAAAVPRLRDPAATATPPPES